MNHLLDLVAETRDNLDNLEEAIELERELHADEVDGLREALETSQRNIGLAYALGGVLGVLFGVLMVGAILAK